MIGIRLADPATEQQRLVAALGYVFTPVVPIIILTSDMKHDQWLRRHAAQALVGAVIFMLALVAIVVLAIALIRQNFLAICLMPVLFAVPFVPGAVWGRRAFLGDDVDIPVITPLSARFFPPR